MHDKSSSSELGSQRSGFSRPLILVTLAVFMYYRLFFLSILSAFVGLATALASPWDDLRVKHAWNTVPDNWESIGPPLSNITINLHIALKSHNENALTYALYEVSTPGYPKYGTLPCTIYLLIDAPCFSIADTVLICQRKGSQNLLRRTQRRSSSFTPGSHTMECSPPTSR